jgi:DNA-directed RNA polymerase specialized sigma24 family protein
MLVIAEHRQGLDEAAAELQDAFGNAIQESASDLRRLIGPPTGAESGSVDDWVQALKIVRAANIPCDETLGDILLGLHTWRRMKKLKKLTVNQKMHLLLLERHAEIGGWTGREWALEIGCSEGTVQRTDVWRRILPRIRETQRQCSEQTNPPASAAGASYGRYVE